ncbi:precorrin-2 C(20)-methyltransferase [Amylibacter ulvae]|uniref:Precorrin-2 C(20)-methyltransferase n=1 Tax=Paramylibacter ulvae TaxID=1651968 RepID=A0ABQ3D4H3_9RHOB|nr:precorrin-2 C(20)-methyltransferase [Amylibacter ulvae]GHA56242.1 precorrin-2 C(20)-methyltransferase [Amylibacter ulvae]
MIGKLYGVGLGPGDPELMTLKAYRLIQNADVIAYPTLEGGESFARAIAAAALPDGVEEIAIHVPMSVKREPAQAAYDTGAAQIAVALDVGKSVVVLCEGDPFFYGSFMYLFSRLSDRYETEVVAGVTSVTACAAAMQKPLTARNEVLTIIPGPISADDLHARVRGAEAVAIMKVGRHLPKIKKVLADLNLTQHAVYVERATLPVEKVLPLADAPEPAPYFSMILVTKGNDPWL